MSFKLNKSIKKHIVQMAIRKKFEADYNDAFAAFKKGISQHVGKETKSHLFENLDTYVLSCVSKTNLVRLNSLDAIKFSDNVKIALYLRDDISQINLSEGCAYGTDYGYYCNEIPECLKEFKRFVFNIEEFAGIIEASLDCFKSANKMFKELPWTEGLYPASAKVTACNIIPVSTIAIANELMGVK